MERNLAKEFREIAELRNSTSDYCHIRNIETQARTMAERGNFKSVYAFFTKPFNIEDIKNYFLSRGFKVEIQENEEIDILILDWSLN